MDELEIVNGKITGVQLENKDRGMLICWINIEYGDGGQQGYGGYQLDAQAGDDSYDRIGTEYGCQCIINILDTFGVKDWNALKGQYCRIAKKKGWNSLIESVGHITEDKWFSFKLTYEVVEKRIALHKRELLEKVQQDFEIEMKARNDVIVEELSDLIQH